jgi:hypothetical protein
MQTRRHPLATSTAHPRPPKPPCLLRTCLLRVVTSHELLLPPSPLALLNTTSELGRSSIDILPMSLLCTFAGGDEFIRSTGKYLSARGSNDRMEPTTPGGGGAAVGSVPPPRAHSRTGAAAYPRVERAPGVGVE